MHKALPTRTIRRLTLCAAVLLALTIAAMAPAAASPRIKDLVEIEGRQKARQQRVERDGGIEMVDRDRRPIHHLRARRDVQRGRYRGG